MKIRMGFVTNSSSSSFIIAKKQDTNRNRVLAYVCSNTDTLNEILKDLRYYDEVPQDIVDAQDNGDHKLAFDLLAEHITDKILDMREDMILGDWLVCAGEASNETDNILYMFIYCSNAKEFDDFKIQTVY